jgi:CheY-like chemotaxis protein
MNAQPILYVEDDENDTFLLRRAFRHAEISQPLVVVPDGNAAVEYLSRAKANENFTEHPVPSLVLLDLNMPGKSGFEVLQWIRTQSQCPNVPVILLTSSHQETDIDRAYSEHANGFIVKPNKPDELLTTVKALRDYWLVQNLGPKL